MAITRNSIFIIRVTLTIVAAIFSVSAMGAQPAPPTQPTTPPPSTIPATPPPEAPKPYVEVDPADKPKPIEINPKDLRIQQPGSIKSAK